MNIYTYSFWARCPADGQDVVYMLRIRSDVMIRAEVIKEACVFGSEFHEDIADKLAAMLPGNHIISAHHNGVGIETVREGVMQ